MAEGCRIRRVEWGCSEIETMCSFVSIIVPSSMASNKGLLQMMRIGICFPRFLALSGG